MGNPSASSFRGMDNGFINIIMELSNEPADASLAGRGRAPRPRA